MMQRVYSRVMHIDERSIEVDPFSAPRLLLDSVLLQLSLAEWQHLMDDRCWIIKSAYLLA